MRLKSLRNVSGRFKMLLDDDQNLLRGKGRCRFVRSSARIDRGSCGDGTGIKGID
jgi:hypothetical protein